MITDGIDSNLSHTTTTKCCSNYDYNSVMGQCSGAVPVIHTYISNGTTITPSRRLFDILFYYYYYYYYPVCNP